MPSHDHAYKLLFSHPQMVRDLIVGFVRRSWQTPIDLRSLEKCNTHFVTENLRSRTSDIVWRVRSGTNDDAYLLLELQSTVDGLMAVRVLTYIGLLYQDLVRSGRMSCRKLQPILPVVPYSGDKRWNAHTSLRSMFRTSAALPAGLRPDVRFHLIDVRRLRLESPKLKHNLAAALFRIENSRNLRAVCEHARSLYVILKRFRNASLRRAFDVWIHRIVLTRFRRNSAGMNLICLEGNKTMLSDRIDRWLVELKAKGRREGERSGRREGRAELLLEQLQTRFGDELPRWAQRQVRKATSAQLKRWGKRVLTAASARELFGRRRRSSSSHRNTALPIASTQSKKH